MEENKTGCVSLLSILDIETGAVETLRRFPGVIEAPNWLKTQNKLLCNADGRIYTYNLDTGDVALIDTGDCTGCNNDHVLSPSEDALGISHGGMEGEEYVCHIYTLPLSGGTPRRVTENSPSFLHGWSPEGDELAYCAFRDYGNGREADIYTVSVDGGEERRLTRGGFNDGPEYAPDGKTIWYNSTRAGLMDVWRMDRNGENLTRMTDNGRNNWFPHLSPDGSRVAFISYDPRDLEPDEHLPDLFVELWLMDSDGSDARCVHRLFGGQGTLNVNSWSPDGKRLAFVSYEGRRE